MGQGGWMGPSMGYDMHGATVAHPVLRVCVDSPHGVTARQFGRLLVAMEELWLSRVGGRENGALRIVEVGNGSVWARIVAESRNAPMATFAAFVATVTACSPDWNDFHSGSGSASPRYFSSAERTPERKFIDAFREITDDDGWVDIRVESDERKDSLLSGEKMKFRFGELTKATERDNAVKAQPYGIKPTSDESKK